MVLEKNDGSGLMNQRRLSSPLLKEDMLRNQLKIASEKFQKVRNVGEAKCDFFFFEDREDVLKHLSN